MQIRNCRDGQLELEVSKVCRPRFLFYYRLQRDTSILVLSNENAEGNTDFTCFLYLATFNLREPQKQPKIISVIQRYTVLTLDPAFLTESIGQGEKIKQKLSPFNSFLENDKMLICTYSDRNDWFSIMSGIVYFSFLFPFSFDKINEVLSRFQFRH